MVIQIRHRREVQLPPTGWEYRSDPGQASSAELLWSFFPGNIEMRVDETEIVSPVASVPALHFAVAVVQAMDVLVLSSNSSYVYNFTEADERITFRDSDKRVYITCSYSESELTVSTDEFSHGVAAFIQRVIRDLGCEYPSLRGHSIVRNLLQKVGDR